MPKLECSQWYDLCRDMNWSFKYVTGKKFSRSAFGGPRDTRGRVLGN